MSKEFLTWEDVDKFAFSVDNLYGHKKFSGVYGPPRGGCILAVMISHRMHIPMLLAPADNCLIVDDICDTGVAMQRYADEKEKYNYTIATMCCKPQSIVVPDFYMLESENQTWVVFPWESEGQLRRVRHEEN